MKEQAVKASTWVLSAFIGVVLAVILVGSFTHTQWLFELREQKGHELWAYVLAVGIDLGIAAATAALHSRRAKSARRFLQTVLTLCTMVSIYANAMHAVYVKVGREPTWADVKTTAQTDILPLITSFVVSIPLPVLMLALSEVITDAFEGIERRVATNAPQPKGTSVPDTADNATNPPQSSISAPVIQGSANNGDGHPSYTCPYCGADANRDGHPFGHSAQVGSHVRWECPDAPEEIIAKRSKRRIDAPAMLAEGA